MSCIKHVDMETWDTEPRIQRSALSDGRHPVRLCLTGIDIGMSRLLRAYSSLVVADGGDAAFDCAKDTPPEGSRQAFILP